MSAENGRTFELTYWPNEIEHLRRFDRLNEFREEGNGDCELCNLSSSISHEIYYIDMSREFFKASDIFLLIYDAYASP